MADQATQTKETGQAAGKGHIDDRENLRNIDIPDAKAAKKPVKGPVSPEVQAEGNLRQYIRPDGVFIKDLPSLRILQIRTGEMDKKTNAPKMKNKYTQAEAEELVIDMCEKSGRKIETDPVSGRPKAVPGWDLKIRVPGHENIEQYAPKEPEGAAREKIRDNAMLAMQDENKTLKERLDRLEAGQGRQPKEITQMSATELRDYAADSEIAVPSKVVGKTNILAEIQKALAERKENES